MTIETPGAEKTPATDPKDAALEASAPAEKKAEGESPAPTNLAEAAEGAKDDAQKTPDLPASADKYDIALPANLALKDEKGDPLEFDAGDPLVQKFRDYAFANKMTQEQFTQALSFHAEAIRQSIGASSDAARSAETDRINKELQALSTKAADGKEIGGAQRVDTLLKNVNSITGDAGASKILAAGLINAGVVKVVEALVQKLLTQPNGKEPPGGGAKHEGKRGAELLKAIRAEA